MRYACLLFSAVAMVGCLAFAGGQAFAQANASAGNPPSAATPVVPDRSQLEARAASILTAANPSEAVEAFAAANRAAPNNPIILSAYVRRMVDFGVPQMAGDQAQLLVKLEPKNGLAWSVVASNAAAKNDYRTALSSIRQAAEYLPADRFVVQTAGNIMGWYDSNYKFADLPQAYRVVISQLNQKLTNKTDFIEAYRQSVHLNACAAINSTATTQRNEVVYGPAYQRPMQAPSVAPLVATRTQQPVYPPANIISAPPQYIQPPVSTGVYAPIYPLGVGRDILGTGAFVNRVIVVPGG